jgi:inosine-uridine nucleoside N-ribohydrolase
MGGGTFGNRSPVAEFNIWADPEAAAAVFGYGGPLVMAGLDVTHQLIATPERIAAVGDLPGRLAGTLADLLRFLSGTYIARHDGALAGAPCTTRAPCSRSPIRTS